MRFCSHVSFLFDKSPAAANQEPNKNWQKVSYIFTLSHLTCACVYASLVVEITEPSAEYLKYLSNTEKYGDHSEGVHGTEEDGFLEVFRHHALGHIKGLFQSAGITHVQRVDLRNRKEKRGVVILS